MKHLACIGCALLVCGMACGEAEAPPAPAAEAPAKPELTREETLRLGAQQLAEKREERRQSMRDIGTATLTKKKLIKKTQKLEMEFTFTNLSDKDLTQAVGNLKIFDSNQKMIKNMKVPFNMEIKAGKTVKKKGKFPVDAGDDADVALVKTDLEDMTFKWNPTLYRFADGSSMVSE